MRNNGTKVFQDNHSGDAEFYEKRGICYRKLNNLGMAIHDFEESVRIDPLRTISWINLGEILFELERYEEAKRGEKKYLIPIVKL